MSETEVIREMNMRLGILLGQNNKIIELLESHNQKLDLIITAFKSWQDQDKYYHLKDNKLQQEKLEVLKRKKNVK